MHFRPLFIIMLVLLSGSLAWAGPPFVTDDPEPVEFNHWEVYIASISQHDGAGRNWTMPHVEVNRGAAPNLQLHIIVPYAFSQTPGMATTSGYGSTELGVKYRFVQETKRCPMVGTFPLIEVPTGNSFQGLGNGYYQFFLPVWLQKSWGKWTSYGGGGYFVNPGPGNSSFWQYGAVLQNDLSRQLTLGAEIFETTSNATGAPNQLNYNIGGQYNFDEGHHLLFSAGHGIEGGVRFLSYIAFQWTFGPEEKKS